MTGHPSHILTPYSLNYYDGTLWSLWVSWGRQCNAAITEIIFLEGIPHATSADDVYNSYHIPEGEVAAKRLVNFLGLPTYTLHRCLGHY